jgi:SynChlorMet cassette radical SAM/SPASM protein ScmE
VVIKPLKTPRQIDIEVTNRCNLHCAYCGYFSSAADVPTELPTGEWLKFFEELASCAVMTVSISGGEPFCRADLEELINGIVRNRMRFGILSNGTLVTEKLAAFLASTGRCNYVQVSVDGSVPEIHDRFRGKGSFTAALAGIKRLQKYGLPVTVRTTIHRYNVHDLEAIAGLLLEDLGLANFSTNAASYFGVCRQNTEEIQLTCEERSLAMKTLMWLNQRYQGRITASAGPLSEGQRWAAMVKARREARERTEGYLSGCGCVFTNLAVRADGIIVPCNQLSHIELGRVNKDNLRDVWLNHPELRELRERREKPLSDFEFCSGCEYIDYCTGNCPALAYTITGDHNQPSPDGCLRLFLKQGGTLPTIASWGSADDIRREEHTKIST